MAGLVLSLVSLLLGAGGILLLQRQPQEATLPRERGGSDSSAAGRPDSRADAAAGLLARLATGLRSGTREQVVDLAAPGDRRAARELTALLANVRRLGITDLSMRYVDENAGPQDADERLALGADGWVGDVQLSWRIRGFDTGESRLEVPVTFREDRGRAWFVTARSDHDGAVPLWMLEALSVRRTGRALVVATADADAARMARLADQAVVDVRKVLPRWRGRLVVEVPSDRRQLTRVLGSPPRAYSSIAAVTTTVDGSQTPGAPVHIFLNPLVFDPLGPRGSQIVISHEATHVATDAALSTMPPWLLEGFADYVALAHVDLPVSVTASQIIAQVRRKGVPKRLPGQAEFDAESKTLGASYESAWLACRLLARMYGERRLVSFYRAVDRSSSVDAAFSAVLGSDLRTFTRAWRDDLRRLAR